MTPDELKKRFADEGRTFTDWAKENGYRRNEVYKVVNGFSKAKRGKGHDIAVALGLKKETNLQKLHK